MHKIENVMAAQSELELQPQEQSMPTAIHRAKIIKAAAKQSVKFQRMRDEDEQSTSVVHASARVNMASSANGNAICCFRWEGMRMKLLAIASIGTGCVVAACVLWILLPDPSFVPHISSCLLYTSPSPRDRQKSRMPSSA